MQNLFTPSERPGSGSVEKNSAKIFTAVFSQCLLSRMGIKKSLFSINISLYLGNDTR